MFCNFQENRVNAKKTNPCNRSQKQTTYKERLRQKRLFKDLRRPDAFLFGIKPFVVVSKTSIKQNLKEIYEATELNDASFICFLYYDLEMSKF